MDPPTANTTNQPAEEPLEHTPTEDQNREHPAREPTTSAQADEQPIRRSSRHTNPPNRLAYDQKGRMINM